MSMEKMKILKMLENGTINSEEAAKLLQASDSESSTRTGGNRMDSERRNKAHTAANNSGRSTTGGRNITDSRFEDFAGELGRKFDMLAKDMEPKIQKFTEVVVERTANVADRISKSLSESTMSRSTYEKSYTPSTDAPERVFEMNVKPGNNELTLVGFNGELLVKGYNGDKISVKVFAKQRHRNGNIQFLNLGDRYFLDYDSEYFEKVIVDALIPENMFKRVILRTVNGRVDISNINTEYFEAQGANKDFEVRNVKSDTINIESNNGAMKLSDITANRAGIENLNGTIQVQSIDISQLKFEAGNSPLNIIMGGFNNYRDYLWSVETSNAKLSLNLPSSPDLGYYVKARTSLNGIRVGLTGLNYLHNESSLVEAKSVNYDSASIKIKLALETSNAPLTIN